MARVRARDKRVYDIRVALAGSAPLPWRLVSVSADCMLPELHRTIQGAFETRYVSEHRISIGATRYSGGKGSRTPLRRVLDVGDAFECDDVVANCRYNGEVLRSYDVASRRHHPKVLDGEGMLEQSKQDTFDPKSATWSAQEACRGFYPAAAPFDRAARYSSSPR